MDSYLERYKAEYEKVKNIRHWSDSYFALYFHNKIRSFYIKGYIDGSDRFEYYYEPKKILFKKEYYFKDNIFKIRYYDDKGNITKVEKTEYYKPEYESLDCLNLPFEAYEIIMLSIGCDIFTNEEKKRAWEKMEKENEEEKRFFEGLNK